MKASFRTYTGREIDLMDMREQDIDIRDIAHHLACINRFNGALMWPVNVAQHSVYVGRLCFAGEPPGPRKADLPQVTAYLLPRESPGFVYGSQMALQGLLHDAAEAYLGDVTKWLKGTPAFTEYRQLEDRIQSMINTKFGCAPEAGSRIEWADRVMVRFEGSRGFKRYEGKPDFRIDHPNYPELTEAELALIGSWRPWSWKTAEEVFLDTFHHLTDQRYRV